MFTINIISDGIGLLLIIGQIRKFMEVLKSTGKRNTIKEKKYYTQDLCSF